jgi:hypothetical protein
MSLQYHGANAIKSEPATMSTSTVRVRVGLVVWTRMRHMLRRKIDWKTSMVINDQDSRRRINAKTDIP